MVGVKIRGIREAKRLKQEYVAAQLGISQAAYSRIESGRSHPSFERVQHIARVLGCSLHDFMDPPTSERLRA